MNHDAFSTVIEVGILGPELPAAVERDITGEGISSTDSQMWQGSQSPEGLLKRQIVGLSSWNF